MKKFIRKYFPKPISRAEIIDADDRDRLGLTSAKDYLRQQDFLRKRNSVILIVLMLLAIVISFAMFKYDYLSKDAFGTIFAAIVGGFVGSAISYILQSK